MVRTRNIRAPARNQYMPAEALQPRPRCSQHSQEKPWNPHQLNTALAHSNIAGHSHFARNIRPAPVDLHL